MARNSWPSILYVIGVSGPGKTNLLLNLINNEPDVDKMYLFAKDIYNAKYHMLINKTKYGHKLLKWFKSFYWILKWDGWYL